MPTISLRISEELKMRIDDLAQESGKTISGVVIDAVNMAVGGGRESYSEDVAPSSVGVVNRLILRNQELLLSSCPDFDADEREAHARNARILEAGYVSEYPRVFSCLRPEVPYGLSEELFGILDMFQILRNSFAALSEEEKEGIEERDISFRGFDLNDRLESPLVGYVDYLFADDRYVELKEPLARFSDGGNSHSPRLEVYRRMHRYFVPIWRQHFDGSYMLGAEEIKRIVSAISYKSGY